jgi:hypothetical protein
MLYCVCHFAEYQLLDSEVNNVAQTAETAFVRIKPEFFAEGCHSCIVIAGIIQNHIPKPVASKVPLCQDISHFVS